MNPQNQSQNTSKTNTTIAVVAAVIVIGLVLGGAFYFANNSVVQSDTTAASGTVATESGSAATTTNQTSSMPSSTNTGVITPNTTTLKIKDEVIGTGATAKAGDHVYVSYVGSFTNGQIFDASANHGGSFDFVLGAGQVIQGWDQGVVGMKVGGTRELIVPPTLGYGPNDYNGIPGGSTLVFTVQLLSIGK